IRVQPAQGLFDACASGGTVALRPLPAAPAQFRTGARVPASGQRM
ncbi:MAG: Ribonuclease HII, partial [uncultured Lysobacter sp.]